MLEITVPAREFFNEDTETFISTKEQSLKLEHSLISLSKWEAKWKKPFLKEKTHSVEETLDYIRFMTINQNVDGTVYLAMTPENLKSIEEYIQDPMTATTFSNQANRSTNREIVTSELIYFWMVSYNIPFECQKWHLNRLMTLIEVCAVKSQPPKKMSRSEIISRNRALNAARRKKYNTKG